jgi:serine/threonine-protein kinase RsbW
VEESLEMKLESSLDSINVAEDLTTKILRKVGFSEETGFGIGLAVREAMANAIVHGKSLNGTSLIVLSFKYSPGTICVEVRDYGKGFDPGSIPDPTEPEHLLRSSGRGIFFIRNFMDKVEWFQHAEGGTTVRMTKAVTAPLAN